MNEQAKDRRELIERSLRIDSMDYGRMVLEGGTRYLELYLADDPRTMEELLATASYWQWWNSQWDRRNVRFIRKVDLEKRAPVMCAYERALCAKVFYLMHDVKCLSLEVRVARWVYRDLWKQQKEHEMKENQR